MTKLTKAELQSEIIELEHEIRRYKRALKQIAIDTNELNLSPSERTVPVNERVLQALDRGQAEWELNVTEPGKGGRSDRISVYIKSRDAMGWTWEEDYTRNGQFAWCGSFAAQCYGDLVRFNIRQKIFPSCSRFYENWASTSRHQDIDNLRGGDIVIVFTSDERIPIWGNHITLALSSPDQDGNFDTIEGNAYGYGPDQTWREGVSKRTRNLNEVAHVYRLLDEDFNE